MTSVIEPEATVRYEGGSVGTELWGGTQANFMVAAKGEHLHEVAVLLTDAVAVYLAEQLGRPDTPGFREIAAREAGQLLIERLLDTGRHVPPFVMLSRAALEAEPEFVNRLKRGMPPELPAK